MQNESTEFESFALGLKTNLEYDITLTASYGLTLAIPSTSNVDQQVIAKLDVDITKYLSLTATVNWQRIGDPVPLADGNVPQSNDTIITMGASVNF